MNQQFLLFRRGDVYYCEDTRTGKQTSLRTKDWTEAQTLLHSRNEAARQPVLNLLIARAYLTAADPLAASRTWQHVLDEIILTKRGENQHRWRTVAKPKALDPIRSRKLIETQAEHVLHVLQGCKVAQRQNPRAAALCVCSSLVSGLWNMGLSGCPSSGLSNWLSLGLSRRGFYMSQGRD